MSDPDYTQESDSRTAAEFAAMRPNALAPKPDKRLTLINAACADMAAREVVRREQHRSVSSAADASVAFHKYHAKFGWTEAQFAEYWKLRHIPPMPGEKQSEWTRLLNREGKRIKAKPRKNENVKDMEPAAAKAHRQKQVREAVARSRTRAAVAVSYETAANGERPLTDEELALIRMAEAEQAAPTAEIADLLELLKAAEEEEERSYLAK